ncbi:hypothetical protein, partial [uncultured Kordia sp.]|uniref:hypothetical protein n=1 Tax=uncultured Kordia sp. TaxID=507699 RepID=UPI0026207A6F
EDATNPVWATADCDGDGTPNGVDPDSQDPCVDDGTVGDEDTSNAIYAAADCDGDGTPNGTDSDPNDPCVGGTVASVDLTNITSAWA